MILGPMSLWRPDRGPLLLVEPTPGSLAAAQAAPVDPGPPSYLQADHLAAYAALRARDGTHRAWTGVATVLDGPLDAEALCRAVRRFLARHEGHRTWFDLDGAEPQRRLVAAEEVELRAVELAGPAPPSGADEAGQDAWHAALQDQLVDLFSARCRPDAWPGWALVAVAGRERAGLIWACDHAFTDAASQIMLAAEVAELYEEEAGRAAPGSVPESASESASVAAEPVGSFLEHVRAERAAGTSFDADSPEIKEWVDVVGRHGRLPRFPLDLGLGRVGTAPVVLREADLLAAAQMEAFDAVCRAAGARTTGGVFAALALTQQLLTGERDYLGLTVLGTRAGRWATSQGWFCTFAPVGFTVPQPADSGFGAVAHAAQAGFERAKRLGGAPLPLVLEQLVATGAVPADSLGSPQLVSYLDLRRFPGVGRPAHAAGVHFTGEGRTGNASLWINRDAERLYVVAQTPSTLQAQAAVSTYLDVLHDVLVAAAAGRVLGDPGARHHR